MLDIEMPMISGMEAAQEIRKIDQICTIVFVTSMAQYAIGGYAVGAADYFLKPVTFSSMKFRLQRIFAQIRPHDKEVVIRSEGAIFRVLVSDILYVESGRHRLIWHTSSGDHESWDTLSHAEELLSGCGFARCNSGYLVSLRHVKKIEGDIAMVGTSSLKISEGRKKAFTAALMDHIAGINEIRR